MNEIYSNEAACCGQGTQSLVLSSKLSVKGQLLETSKTSSIHQPLIIIFFLFTGEKFPFVLSLSLLHTVSSLVFLLGLVSGLCCNHQH